MLEARIDLVPDHRREAIAVQLDREIARRLIGSPEKFRVRPQNGGEDGESDPFRGIGKIGKHWFPQGTRVFGGASLSARLAVGNPKTVTVGSISPEIPNAPDPARFSADHIKRLRAINHPLGAVA